jgi:hypothetical protein
LSVASAPFAHSWCGACQCHYSRAVYEKDRYKSAKTVIQNADRTLTHVLGDSLSGPNGCSRPCGIESLLSVKIKGVSSGFRFHFEPAPLKIEGLLGSTCPAHAFSDFARSSHGGSSAARGRLRFPPVVHFRPIITTRRTPFALPLWSLSNRYWRGFIVTGREARLR